VSVPFGIAEAAVLAVAAGTDLLCFGRDQDQDTYLAVRDALAAAASSGRIPPRRLEDAAVERRGSHGAGAFGAAEAGAFGAAGAGETARRGPDTIAIREIPLAASSSITDTTSPYEASRSPRN